MKAKRLEREYFMQSGETHALIRRSTLFWNTSTSAAVIADAAFHQERLKRALAAVQATYMLGLRERASSIFVGEFMRKNLLEAALHADKVISIYMHAAT